MHDVTRTANLLGAAALVVSDLTLAGVTAVAGVSASGAAALVVLHGAPGLSVTELGRRVGLSQSAAARMVDALESRDLVTREPRAGRVVHVRLTSSGWRAAGELVRTRGSLLRELLDDLDADQLDGLESALGVLLARVYRRVSDADLMCRLCDRACCTRDAVCPVGAAARGAGVRGAAARGTAAREAGAREAGAREAGAREAGA